MDIMCYKGIFRPFPPMPNTYARAIYEIAEPRNGYFTMAQAKVAGIRPNAVVKMAQRGIIERVSRGVYRVVNFPPFRHGQLMEASLWPYDGVPGVISHESALRLHELSDVSPAKVHITLPSDHRVRRAVPPYLVVHHAELPATDVEILDGIPVTTPCRSIVDGHAAHLGTDLIRQAIDDGRRSGRLTAREAEQLRAALIEKNAPDGAAPPDPTPRSRTPRPRTL